MTTIVAIDPGKNGGIAWKCGDLSGCEPMPETEGDVVAVIRRIIGHTFKHGQATIPASHTVFYLEDLVKHMGAGIPGSAMAVYASNWGFIKGCVQYSGAPLHLVNPSTWARSLGLGTSKGMSKREWKAKLKGHAQRLYPHLEITLKTADALLLLTYAVKQQSAGVEVPD